MRDRSRLFSFFLPLAILQMSVSVHVADLRAHYLCALVLLGVICCQEGIVFLIFHFLLKNIQVIIYGYIVYNNSF